MAYLYHGEMTMEPAWFYLHGFGSSTTSAKARELVRLVEVDDEHEDGKSTRTILAEADRFFAPFTCS